MHEVQNAVPVPLLVILPTLQRWKGGMQCHAHAKDMYVHKVMHTSGEPRGVAFNFSTGGENFWGFGGGVLGGGGANGGSTGGGGSRGV